MWAVSKTTNANSRLRRCPFGVTEARRGESLTLSRPFLVYPLKAAVTGAPPKSQLVASRELGGARRVAAKAGRPATRVWAEVRISHARNGLWRD